MQDIELVKDLDSSLLSPFNILWVSVEFTIFHHWTLRVHSPAALSGTPVQLHVNANIESAKHMAATAHLCIQTLQRGKIKSVRSSGKICYARLHWHKHTRRHSSSSFHLFYLICLCCELCCIATLKLPSSFPSLLDISLCKHVVRVVSFSSVPICLIKLV